MLRFSIRSLLAGALYIAVAMACCAVENDLAVFAFVYGNAFLLAFIIGLAHIRSNTMSGIQFSFATACLVFFLADTQTGYSLASILADLYTDGGLSTFPNYSVSVPYTSNTSTYTVYVPDTRYREAHVFRCASIVALSIISTSFAAGASQRFPDQSPEGNDG
ncbi:hypothetical protein [Planctomycetes bacterium CA13]